MSNQEQLRAKSALQAIFLRIQSTLSKRARTARKIETAKCVGHYFQIPLIVQPVSRTISCLPCTQGFIERTFSHLKLVLRENRVRMGNKVNDVIVFMRTNKVKFFTNCVKLKLFYLRCLFDCWLLFFLHLVAFATFVSLVALFDCSK